MTNIEKAELKKQNRNIKVQELRRTKQNIICKINEMKEDGHDIIIVESVKRKTLISINEFVTRELEKITKNKSKFIEDLLIEVIEKELHKKIEFTKLKDNYPL